MHARTPAIHSPNDAQGTTMARESCFCGRVGELEDRELVYAGDGEWGLGCPMCGHLDRLEAWSEAARAWTLAEAARRQRDLGTVDDLTF
jgi:hypothetical protein